jgi:hypothetical protein
MTAINRLTNKTVPVDNDLIPIWDSQAGRTRNTSFAGAGSLLFGNVNPVTDVSYTTPNLLINYFNGTTKSLNIKEDDSSGFVPINGGVWAADVDFNAYNEFMIYLGVPYKPKPTTVLPYTSTAVPNVNFVEPFSDLTSDNLGKLTSYYFNTISDVLTGTTIGGAIVSLKEGYVIKIFELGNSEFEVVTGAANGLDRIDLGSGLTTDIRIKNNTALIESFGATLSNSSDSIERAILFMSGTGGKVTSLLPSTVLDRPLYFFDATVNDLLIDFSGTDISLIGARTEGTTFDWEYGAFTFFGEDIGTPQETVLTETLPADGPDWEVTNSSLIGDEDFLVIEVDPGNDPDSGGDFSTKTVWRLVKNSNVVSATQIEVNYLRGYEILSGTRVKYQPVNPCRGITFRCKSISYDRPYNGSNQAKLEASSGVVFYKAFNCHVDNFEYKKNPKQAAHFEFTMSCSAKRVFMYNPIELTSGGYNTQFEKSILFEVDSLVSDDGRHIFDMTASSDGIVSNSSSAVTQNSSFTTHGAFEHDVRYEGNYGHFQVAGSGPNFGDSAKRITVSDHVGSILNARSKVVDLTLKRCVFLSTADLNADGLVIEDNTILNDIRFYSSSSESSRENIARNSELRFGGVAAFQAGVDVAFSFEYCKFPNIATGSFESYSSLLFSNCELINDGSGSISTPISCKKMVFEGGIISGVCFIFNDSTDQEFSLGSGVKIDYNNRPSGLALVNAAKTSGNLTAKWSRAKSVSNGGRHLTAITSGATLRIMIGGLTDMTGGTIQVDDVVNTGGGGYLFTSGVVFDGVTVGRPSASSNYVYGDELDI